MNSKERLIAVLSGQQSDRLPCICPGGMMNMVTNELMRRANIFLPEAHKDAEEMAALARAVYDSGCFDNYGVPFCMTVEAEAMGARVDLGSIEYEPHVVEYAIESSSQWRELRKIDLRKGRGGVVIDAIAKLKALGNEVPIIGNLTGPVSTASSLLEPTTFYKEMRKRSSDVHEFMSFITDSLITFGKAQAEAGADVIAISDPSGTGEILGPKLFEEYTVRYLNLILDALAETGIKTIVHICGQLRSVYENIDKLRSNALSFDSVVSMSEARRNLPGRILMGNVSTFALEFGNVEKIERLTSLCLKNGSNIISPACGLGMNSPIENVQAMRAYLERMREDA